jgi:hypothetical protein
MKPDDVVKHPSWGSATSKVNEVAVATKPLPESGAYRGGWRPPHEGEAPDIARCAVPEYLMSCWYPIRDLKTVTPGVAEGFHHAADGTRLHPLSECKPGICWTDEPEGKGIGV